MINNTHIENLKSISTISLKNLRYRPFRTGGLIILVSFLSFLLYSSIIMSLGYQNTISNLEARLGADMMVVPLGNEGEATDILLTGQPSCFYLPQSVVGKIQNIDGVEATTSQFYLASLSAECCDVPVQIVGFNPDTDFTILPWLTTKNHIDDNSNITNNRYTNTTNGVIIGADINTYGKNTIKLYDKEYNIIGRFDKTGNGMDTSVFANMNTLQSLYEGAKSKDVTFLEDANPTQSVSTIFVKVKEGYDKKQIEKAIRKEVGAVQIIISREMLGNISNSIDKITYLLYTFIIIILIITLVVLSTIFIITIGERKREFVILTIVGVTKKRILQLIISEGLIISIIGGIMGTGLSALIIFTFHIKIEQILELRYMSINAATVIAITISNILIAALIGPLTSIFALSQTILKRSDTYIQMRE